MRRYLVSIVVSCMLALSLGVLLNAEAKSNVWTTTASAVRILGSRLIHTNWLAPFPTAPDAPELGAPPPPPPGPAGDLDQCANGGVGQTPVACSGAAWQNGNLNGNQAHYLEGDSVPYRLRLTGVATTPGVLHTVTIAYDTTHSNGGNHALDYLTSFDRTESTPGNNPCSGVAGCDPEIFHQKGIPDDPNLPFDVGEDGTPGTEDDDDLPLSPLTGMMTLYGGDLVTIDPPFRSLNAKCITPAPDYSGATVTCVKISFTADVSNPVLAWGGHLSTRIDWAPEPSSIAINGSPYHMRLIDIDGSGGNQDRSLSADAVFFPATLDIVKVTQNDQGNAISNSDVFSFTTTGTDLSNFTLNTSDTQDPGRTDIKTFSLTDTSTRTVTEADPSPDYTLTALDCTVTPFPGLNANPPGSALEDLQNRLATITPAEGDAISCTYINRLQTGTVIINKVANGGDATFNFNGTGGGGIPTSFSITTGIGSDSVTYSAVTIGSKTVTEVVPTGWDLTDITCSDPDNGSSDSGQTATIDLDQGETVTCTFTNTKHAPAIELVKTGSFNDANKSGFPDPGETISYTFTVTNTGNVTLTNITITDPKITVLGGSIASLAAGASDNTTFTGTYALTQADIDAGSVTNTADACGDPPSGPEVCDDDNHTQPLPQNPALNVVKASTTTAITHAGQVVPYTFTVTNIGNITLTVITVSDPNCNSAPTLDSGDTNGNSKLEVTETWSYSCSHTVTAGEISGNGGGDGDLDNTVTADSAETGPDTDDHAILITLPNLIITKTPDQAGDTGYEVTTGGVAAFTITVQNIGKGPAFDTLLTDTLPSGVGNWTENPDTLCTIASGVTLECKIGTLAAGASFVVTVQATIPADFLIPPDQGQGTSPFEIEGNLTVDTAGKKDWANAGIGCTSTPKVGCDLDLPSGKTDNAFGQGTKEDTAIPSVVFGAIPNNKSDLIRFYVANERVLSTDFLYLAWERVQAPKGTTNMDFELNQSGTLSTNGVTPVRTAGDLLLKFDLDQGGTVPTLGYHKWVTAASAGGQTPAQACEAANQFPCWGKGLTLTASVDAEINPGIVSDPINPNAPRDLDPVTFGEALIDLQASDIFPEPGDPGFACVSFGQAYLKSRSSSSFSSEIKDFIAPIPIRVSNCAAQNLNNTASVTATNFAPPNPPLSDTGQIKVVPPASLSSIEGGSDVQPAESAGLFATDQPYGARTWAPIASTRRGIEYVPTRRVTRLMR